MPNPYGRPKGSKNDPAKATRLPFKQSTLQMAIRACVRTDTPIERIVIDVAKGTFVIEPRVKELA